MCVHSAVNWCPHDVVVVVLCVCWARGVVFVMVCACCDRVDVYLLKIF